ncbi:D-lactate dehydrogenase [Trichosporon asahii var. asahii CBS 8904]|uniref:D-lactate dehydrogenase n=2 Tax=Trichosporon asahii var. asahii TaxID=189963 RepID=K1VYK7_TRIAC|nr:D-lactate dehydrogenase [Trichosporon asahii var. asahii CBS 2479]EJT50675.1 D-lactate dehydrogenase [Trichosporon asahii var. asahii CBS 2479]EKD01838.1 D-lactate dehydrogenase [Trichosporon asahii var. asahii CBS 8904]
MACPNAELSRHHTGDVRTLVDNSLTPQMSTVRSFARALGATRRVALSAPARPVFRAPLARSVRYGSHLPDRNSSFTKVTEDHVKQMRSMLGSPSSLLTTLDGSSTADDLANFNNDWMNKYHGHSQVVVKPKTTEEVSSIMKFCNENNIAVVPQGGNTGLVGG